MTPRLTMILVLGALVALGPLTIDMYLPALPALTADLATTSSTAQLTLTGTLVGLALGQLVIGPLSDTFGRRRPLLAGAALHVAASLAITVAPNVAVLGALRVLQGVGAAAGAVISLAIIRDLYTGRPAATMFSRLMLVMGAFFVTWILLKPPPPVTTAEMEAARKAREEFGTQGPGGH